MTWVFFLLWNFFICCIAPNKEFTCNWVWGSCKKKYTPGLEEEQRTSEWWRRGNANIVGKRKHRVTLDILQTPPARCLNDTWSKVLPELYRPLAVESHAGTQQEHRGRRFTNLVFVGWAAFIFFITFKGKGLYVLPALIKMSWTRSGQKKLHNLKKTNLIYS